MAAARGVAVGLVLVPLLLLAGCGRERPAVLVPGGPAASPSPKPPPMALAVTPAVNAQQLPISTEIGTAVTNGTVTSVTLVDAAGAAVAGQLRDDGTSWVPDKPLQYKRGYTATVTATGVDGTAQTQTTSFTTMARPGGGRVGTGLYLFENVPYGVAMPVVVEFDEEIPPAARAGIERRMFVTTNPPQPGAWGWLTPRQVFYRGPTFWQAGTTLTARIALDGHPMGNGRYGDMDRRGIGHIGDKVVIDVDNATKQLQFFRSDQLVRTMPVSLGKPATPSSSGTMVIMDKQRTTVFDTRGDPNPVNRYVVDIEYAQRLTWGGEFIHAAPWSVAQQGNTNVSHGCVNVSMSNAQWLYDNTRIGDPVRVRGTERRVEPGNGWTPFDLTWDEFVARSASPPPPVATAITPRPTASSTN